MTHFGMLLLTYTAVVCQTSLADALTVSGVIPDFVGIVVVVCALNLRGASAIFWAALAGLTVDCLMSSHLGVNMLIAVALTFSVQACIAPDLRKSAFAQFLLGIVLIAALLAGSTAAQLLFSRQTVVVRDIVPTAFKTAAYSMLFAVVLRLSLSLIWRIVPGFLKTSRTPQSKRWAMIER